MEPLSKGHPRWWPFKRGGLSWGAKYTWFVKNCAWKWTKFCNFSETSLAFPYGFHCIQGLGTQHKKICEVSSWEVYTPGCFVASVYISAMKSELALSAPWWENVPILYSNWAEIISRWSYEDIIRIEIKNHHFCVLNTIMYLVEKPMIEDPI